MGACFSTPESSLEDNLRVMFTKFRQHRAYDLAKAEPGKNALGRPVLVTGKVAALGGQILKSPVSGKDCVYYKVIIEKKETRTRTKHVTPGMSRKTKVMEGKEIHEEFFVWVHQATEEMKVDFRLISGDNFIDVPLSKVPVVAHAIRDVVGLKDAADSKVRRTEMSFHVGETVSLIGQLASSSDAENAIIGAVCLGSIFMLVPFPPSCASCFVRGERMRNTVPSRSAEMPASRRFLRTHSYTTMLMIGAERTNTHGKRLFGNRAFSSLTFQRSTRTIVAEKNRQSTAYLEWPLRAARHGNRYANLVRCACVAYPCQGVLRVLRSTET